VLLIPNSKSPLFSLSLLSCNKNCADDVIEKLNYIMAANYHLLLQKLDEFIRKYYTNQLIRGSIYSLTLLLVFFLTVVSLEHFGRFESTIRSILFYSFLALSIAVLLKWIIIPLSKLYRIGHIISHEQAAEIIGKYFNNIEDKLLNVLQLKKQTTEISVYSPELIEASINQKITELKPVPFSAAVNLSENKKYARFAIIPLGALILLIFSAPSVITESTRRLVDYNTYYEKPAPFHFELQNEELQAIQHEDFLLKVKITGDFIPDNAFVEYDNTRIKLNKEGKILFEHQIKNLQKTIKFRFFADDVYSEEYELSVLPNPIVLDFTVDLEYPKYIGRKNESFRNTGDLVIPEGTKVKWVFNTLNSRAVHFTMFDSTRIIPPSSANNYQFSHTFSKSTPYSVKTANEYITGKDSVTYAINVISDQYPNIEVEERADSLSSKRLYFRGQVKDDYGFRRLTFNYKPLNKDGAQAISQELSVNKNTTQDQFFHLWDLSAINIQAGEEIEYYFEIWDNDGYNGSKSTKTQKMVFKAPSLKEIAQNTEKKNDQIKQDLQSTLKEARNLQRELNDMNRSLLDKKNLNWDDKKKVEDLLKRQKELQDKVENIQQQNQQKNNQQNEYQQMDEKLLQKQEQLQNLMEQILTDEMKEMFKQLEELLDKMDKNKLQEQLDKMKFDNKDLEKELDRALELFKQLEFEQKLEETIDKLKDLKNQQEELSKQSEDKNAKSDEIQKKQEELKKEFEEVKKDIQDLEKKNSELERPNDMQDTKSDQKNIEQEMQKSSDQLQKNQNKKASESQKNAAQKMDELSQKLEQMQADSQQQQSEEDINALRDILENLIRLSFDQEDIMLKLKTTNRNDPQYLKHTQTQKKLKDDAKIIEDSLFALSKRVPQLDAIINREISAINNNMDKAISHLAERQTPQANSRQQYSMTAANNLALLLSEALKQMQQQQAQQKAGEGSCSKPGASGKPKPSASEMKKMQDQINQQIQKLKEQMGKEGKEGNQGKKPGGGSGMSEQLAKLAAQQAALRQQLQKMANEMGNDKGGKQALDKIAQQMEQTETDLVNKRITPETLKRQQEIMTRLLEAENAEREREMDEKRESKEGKNSNFSNPADFFEYKRLKEKEAELLKTVPPSLNPFYKNKVTEYFNNLEE
jgi:hypothetical protein